MTQNSFAANRISSGIPPSTNWKEQIEPGEGDLFERFAHNVLLPRQTQISQRTDRPAQRALHMKLHAGVIAEFQVLPDLPEHARFGVFREPRVFPALVRFSNGESSNIVDKKPQPRGIAIKLIGVLGPKLLEDQKDAVTQDFLATSHSVTSTVRHVREFMAFVESNIEAERAPPLLRLPFTFALLARKLGVSEAARIGIALLRTVGLGEVRSLATERYFSPAPIKFGPYAVKFTVQPAGETKPATNRPQTDDFLREELTDRLRTGDLMFDFVVQFYVNEKLTPIEDSSIPWTVEQVTVARLRIPKCDLLDPHTQVLSESVNRLSFSPWHTTEDHRPLGNVMRARKVAYQMSSGFRHSEPEPTSLPV
jgi:hypothetical protein